jgi:crotonyl-CoA reductase
MQAFLDAIQSGASGDDLGHIPLPESYRAALVRKDEAGMFEGIASPDKDPRKSLHVEEVPVPELAPDEAHVVVMASAINFNTVWTSIFEPLPTFAFLQRLGRESAWGARHDQPYHVVGSDASGVVIRVGSAVRNWKPGDKVTIHCNYVDDQDPTAHDDSMLAVNQRIWGFESNFGGLADLTLVKANQLMPKPAHLSWEEAACNALTNSTSYRMIVSHNGAPLKQGDIILVWGAGGGLGGYAVQYALNGGAIPVGVVSSPEKVSCCTSSGARPSSTGRRRPSTSGGTSTPRTRASGGASASAYATSSATTPTSCSSIPVARRWARRCSCASAAARSSRAQRRAVT